MKEISVVLELKILARVLENNHLIYTYRIEDLPSSENCSGAVLNGQDE